MNETKREAVKSKILIADDNRDMAFLLKKGIGAGDFVFVEAHDGEETIRKVAEEKPDLILLDLKMPKKNGLAVIGELRDTFEFRDIPIIVLTVVENPEEKLRALELGANDFLVKPPSSTELKARVNTQLQLHRIATIFKRYSVHLESVVSRKTRELRDFTDRLEELVDEKVGVIKRQNEELLLSMRSAQKIQRSFLPAEFPRVQGLRFSVLYRPRDAVGGDIYNVFRIDEDTIGVFVADVSGHGIPSAMITIFMRQEVLYQSKQVHKEGGYTVTGPAELLARVNGSFVRNNIGEGVYFVTAVYGTYSLKKRELRLSIAGHHALPLVKRAGGGLEAVRIESFPIGWFEDAGGYEERSFSLGKGDSALFYTDGLLETCLEGRNPVPGTGSEAGGGGEGAAALGGAGEGSLVEPVSDLFLRDGIVAEVGRLIESRERGGGVQGDDLTMLLMEIT